jgi:hypothetical protein
LEIPLSPGTFRHLKHGSHSNLKLLDVRDDETPQANPRPRLSEWARFASGVSSQKKTISLTETLTPWVILSSFGGSANDEGYWSKGGFWKTKMDSRAPGVSPLGLSHRNLGNWRHFFYFWYTKGLIPNPPINIYEKSLPPNRALCGFHLVKEKCMKRLRDSWDSTMWKKKSWKGSVIAEIPPCERKIREKAQW